MGSPLGLEQTASEGIVSAVRDLPDGTKLLQVTAAVSPGSSGGPVLNARGEAVGIACFLLTEGQSLNFAVPINEIKPGLRRRGKVTGLAEAGMPEFLNSAEGLYLLGLYLLPEDENAPGAKEKYEAALEAFRLAVEKRKDYAEAHFFFGYCLGKLGRHQEAVEEDREAIRLKPDDAGAHCNLGWAYGNLGRWQEAVEECKQAIRLKPDLADAHYDLGWAYSNLERWAEAVEEWKEAIRLKPDDAEAHSNLGAAFGNLGRYQEEVKEYKEAIRLKPDLAVAHSNLGATYLFLGDRSRALDEYSILKDLAPDLAAKLFELLYP